MDANRNKVKEMSIARTMEKLRKNFMEAAYLPTAQDVVPMLRSLLEDGQSIALGGSMSLAETGALALVRSGPYRLIDRYEQGLSPEALHERLVQGFSADVFLTGVNAITEHGELYNIRRNRNRVARCYWTKRVIESQVAEDCPTLRDAVDRVKPIAAPATRSTGS